MIPWKYTSMDKPLNDDKLQNDIMFEAIFYWYSESGHT